MSLCLDQKCQHCWLILMDKVPAKTLAEGVRAEYARRAKRLCQMEQRSRDPQVRWAKEDRLLFDKLRFSFWRDLEKINPNFARR